MEGLVILALGIIIGLFIALICFVLILGGDHFED